MIILITLAVFLLFIVALVWAAKRDKEKNGYNIFTPMPTFEKNFIDIAQVQDVGDVVFNSVTQTEELSLSQFRGFFNYPNDPLATLEFELSKQHSGYDFFEISNVTLHTQDKEILAQRILLMEKVPDHVAPPNGCRYFDHEYYRPFCLKDGYPTTFLFDASFDQSLHSLKTSDHVTIEVEVYNKKRSDSEKYDVKNIKFKQNLAALASKNIIQFKHDLQNICRD